MQDTAGDLLDFIQDRKTVALDELAAHFGLRTQARLPAGLPQPCTPPLYAADRAPTVQAGAAGPATCRDASAVAARLWGAPGWSPCWPCMCSPAP